MDLEAGLGEALRTDSFMLREEFTPAQLDYLERARGFVHEEVLPVINGYWERAEAIHTFEGTATIQNLIVGRDITGVSAFTAGA